ncbi:hypothetical protein ACWEKU_27720 [Streptomyces californicus]
MGESLDDAVVCGLLASAEASTTAMSDRDFRLEHSKHVGLL